MKNRFVFAALAGAVLLTPVVLTIGAFVLIPLSLVVLPVLLVFAVVALPALVVSAIGNPEPTTRKPTFPAAHTQPPIAYSR